MNLEEYFEEIGYQEILKFVEEKREEDVYLEFKTAVHLNVNDQNKNSDKKNLSKCISGFANSNGGIIIWGVEAVQKGGIDCASKLVPIEQLKKFANRLNSLEGQSVSPIVEGIRHNLILIDSENDKGFIKTLIPKSKIAPHMANYADKHYYKRSGDSFYMAEHYDIADMFARNSSPILDVKICDVKWKRLDNNFVRFEVAFALENKGNVIAKYPYLSVWVNGAYVFDEFGLDGNGFTGLKRTKRTSHWRDYSGGNTIVVYPNVMLEVDKVYGVFSLLKREEIYDLKLSFQFVSENMNCVEKKIELTVEEILIPQNADLF